jgi:hypothetical protein
MRQFRGTLVGVYASLAVVASSWAAEPEAPRRQLGPHLFIPRVAIDDPFTTTTVGSETGFGYATAEGPTFDLNGNPVTLADYKIIAYSQAFSGQWGIFDWWALRVRATGLVYSGANGSAAAGVGLNGVVRAGAGTTFAIRPLPTLQLGLLFDVSVGPSVGLDILQAIRSSIAEDSVQAPVVSTNSTTLTPALSAAWTITRGLGFVANVSYTHNSVSADAASVGTDTLALGGGLDLDLRELGTIPLGLTLSYQAGYSIGDERFRRYRLAGGFFYTRRENLTLGLELAYTRAPLGAHDVFISTLLAVIVLRYNFD